VAKALTLNPADEFESVLIDMASTYRKKGAHYGDKDGDPLWNFNAGAEVTNTTPQRYVESLMAKHSMALRQWFKRVTNSTVNPKPTVASDDAYMDRAVYAVIANVLYRRSKTGT
jgi:hypothetical protein